LSDGRWGWWAFFVCYVTLTFAISAVVHRLFRMALGLATPTAVAVGDGGFGRQTHNILVKDAATLEGALRAVNDRGNSTKDRGTLTEGKPRVVDPCGRSRSGPKNEGRNLPGGSGAGVQPPILAAAHSRGGQAGRSLQPGDKIERVCECVGARA